MNKTKNPFSPGAGSPPPELAGRDTILVSLLASTPFKLKAALAG